MQSYFRTVVLISCFASCTAQLDAPVESASPIGRSGFALAYDSGQNNVVLFGGADSSSNRLDDTWTWTPDGWTIHNVAGPSARSDAQIAYDSANQQTVLFGGLTTDGRSGETWTWDGAAWSLADSTGPTPRQLKCDGLVVIVDNYRYKSESMWH